MNTLTKLSTRARLQQRQEAHEGYVKEQLKVQQVRLENTARLKALRLAKEAADRAAGEAPPKSASKKKSTPKRPPPRSGFLK